MGARWILMQVGHGERVSESARRASGSPALANTRADLRRALARFHAGSMPGQ